MVSGGDGVDDGGGGGGGVVEDDAAKQCETGRRSENTATRIGMATRRKRKYRRGEEEEEAVAVAVAVVRNVVPKALLFAIAIAAASGVVLCCLWQLRCVVGSERQRSDPSYPLDTDPVGVKG